MRVLSLVCVSLLLFSVVARPQTDSNQQKYNISGTVVSATDGQPVRGALVEIIAAERKSGMTGADGHFEIDGVAAGYVNINARRPGFNGQNQPLQRFKIDGNTDSIRLKLTPLSKISGRVLDRQGEPIEGVFIKCLVEQITNGRKQWQQRGGANSDETGNFLLEDLTPGRYILGTQEKQLYMVQPKAEAARYIYPPTFYPDSPSRDLAQQMELTPGQDMKVDMTLRSARGTRVSLITVPASNEVAATIGAEDEQYGGGINALADKSGALVFAAVPPGNWRIVVRSGGRMGMHGGSMTAGDDTLYGELPVEVGSTDIDNLKLPLGKLSDIPVIVSGMQNPTVALQLVSKNGMIAGGSEPEQNGELKIRRVAPGTYRVVVQVYGGTTGCVTSMMSGSQDLMRDELTISTGSQAAPILVTESSTCAQLSVSSNQNATVVIVSDRKAFDPKIATVAGTNSALIGGLSDGDYKVYAFDDITDLEYANSEAMRDFKGQSVHLESGQKASVQLEVNERRAK